MSILQSGEDYLERILMLQKQNGSVRAIDIANSMNYSKPSVSVALKKLKAKYLCEDKSTKSLEYTDDINCIHEDLKIIDNLIVKDELKSNLSMFLYAFISASWAISAASSSYSPPQSIRNVLPLAVRITHCPCPTSKTVIR